MATVLKLLVIDEAVVLGVGVEWVAERISMMFS
jgi:hypothetical protein